MYPIGPKPPTQDFRLPTNVKPSAYSVSLKPDIENGTFEGNVVINVDVKNPTRIIELNAKDLVVSRAVLTTDSGACEAKTELIPKTERLVLTFATPVPTGKGTIALDFTGVLNDQMTGFYRSSYSANGEKRLMATTQFEDTDARRAFPCFDEPALKATFEVTLTIPAHLEAISNTPVRNIKTNGRGKTVRFQKTPIMSTYLLAFMVGEFEWIEGKTAHGTAVRVITTPGKSKEGGFALDVGIRTLEFYEDYFGIPYPLPKLDMAAIPDFAFGAMENWGLITYREKDLLVNQKESSTASKQRVAIVVAHEIAHQWFGNLVTMEWWRQLWLNEGFATWMEYFAVDHLFPEWKMWEQFVADDYTDAKAADSLRSTHAVEIETDDPAILRQSFDTVSYQKGACIIRMIHAFVGPDAFRSGLRAYFLKHAYGNTATEDLWDALEEASGKPVRVMMDGWTKQAGYPVVTVSEEPGHDVWKLTQSRFLANGDTLTPEESKERWQIPLECSPRMSSENTKDSYSCTLPSGASGHKMSASKCLKVNSGETTFARLCYPKDHWKKLGTAVKESELGSIDRLGLLDDLYALVRASMLPATTLLEFLGAYKGERSYIVASEVIGSLGGIVRFVEDTPTHSAAKQFGLSLIRDVTHKLGWEEKPDEGHTTQLMRPMLLSACGAYDDLFVVERARSYFSDYCEKGPSAVPANLRMTVLGTVACHPNQTDEGIADFEKMIAVYRTTERSEEKMRILSALGAFESTAIIPRLHGFAFSNDVRRQDTVYVFGGIGGNRHLRRPTWTFVMEHFDELKKRYDESGTLFGKMLESVLSAFVSEEDARQIEAFFAEHPAPKVSKAIARSLERIRLNARWRARDLASVEQWLFDWSKGPGSRKA